MICLQKYKQTKRTDLISNKQFTTSLFTNAGHSPYLARLYSQENGGAWTVPGGSHWLQIDLCSQSIRNTEELVRQPMGAAVQTSVLGRWREFPVLQETRTNRKGE